MTQLLDRAAPAPGPRAVPPRPATAPRPRRRSDPDRISLAATLIGQLSLLAGASALTAVLADPAWVLPLVEVVGVIWLLGVGCRLLRSPAPVTVLVQFAGLAVVLTSLFTSSGWGGFLPGPRSFADAGDLLSDAWRQIQVSVPPAAASPALVFLVCLTVGTTALILDFLIAEAQAPALTALPLLCLYSVPASIATDPLPWWTFAAPALLYAALLAATGRIRLGGARRAGVGLLASGLVVAGVATAGGLVIGDAVTGVGTEGRLPRSTTGGGDIGISPFTSLRGELNQQNPQVLLRVRGQSAEDDDYLRVTALERWNPGADAGFQVGPLDSAGDPASGIQLTQGVDDADVVPVTIESIRYASEYLPIFTDTTTVQGLGSGWNWDPSLASIYRDGRVNPRTYTVNTSFARPTMEELRVDTVSEDPELTDSSGIPDSVRRTAQQVTAGASTPFDKADALYRWFTDPANGFTYSLNVPAGSSGDLLADFLEQKRGFCEQYASAMAAMLRTLGIPSRVVVGFTQGTLESDGSRTIATDNAHAWVEVRFDEHGWVRFDPTPLGPTQGQQNGFTEGAGGDGGTASNSPSTEVTDTAGAVPSANRPDGQDQGLNPDDGGTETTGATSADDLATTPTATTDGFRVPAAVWWGLVVVLLLAVLVVVPGRVRQGRRSRRMATATAGGPGAAAAAWAEIEDLMVDHDVALVPTESSRTTANRVARTAGLGEHARRQLRSLVVAAEHDWYAQRTDEPATAGGVAVAAPPTDDLVGAVRSVRTGLDRAAPLSLVDRWFPRSVRPGR